MPETVQDMELALEARYRDGERLLASPAEAHNWGGIYLMGYVAEMVLKLSYFHLKGSRPTDPTSAELSIARRDATRLGVVHKERDFDRHNLAQLSDLVSLIRADVGLQALPPDLQTGLRVSVVQVHQIWSVSMRYMGRLAQSTDALDVYRAVSWLRAHYYRLWS